MGSINKHLEMKRLVELGVVIPGVYSGTLGNITYSPISVEEYYKKIESGDTANLAYNTRAMGRGIFSFNDAGQLINYKGVDSSLNNSDSIAVASTEGELQNVNDQESYGINIVYFQDKVHGHEATTRAEIRVKGASSYQNLIYEKILMDGINRSDKKRLVKLPQLSFPKPLSAEMCERYNLPRQVPVSKEFLDNIDSNSYGGYCLKQMLAIGIPFNNRNQLWREYFDEYHQGLLESKELEAVIAREDSVYNLGATFGQSTRALESPFRIMELQYYLRQNNIDALKAILDFSTPPDKDLLDIYSVVAAKNVAGLMNVKYLFHNFQHRQDFPLSGEICDDEFEDVSKYLNHANPTKQEQFKIIQFYSQVYTFATNMKIIEDAYMLTGRAVTCDCMRQFVETFYDSLEDKSHFDRCFKGYDLMTVLKRVENAENNFSGMNDFMKKLREIALEISNEKEKNPKRQQSATEFDN